jgi:mevalonate kinase
MTIVWKDAEPRWIEYVQRILKELVPSSGHLRGTLMVESGLPLGKGMGSSTALVVAMSRCLLGGDSENAAKKAEDAVNPGNSGLDFAVIWNEESILFERKKEPQIISLPENLLKDSELIDTGKPNETTPELVAWIRSRVTEIRQPIEIIGQCTDRLLRGEPLKEIFRDHHRAQIALGVVPEAVQKKIAMLEASGGSAKVLGAGARTGEGGGMVLVIR